MGAIAVGMTSVLGWSMGGEMWPVITGKRMMRAKAVNSHKCDRKRKIAI